MREFKNVAELADCVGEEIGVSEWFSIDQNRINDFADATGDHQWIHIDPERTETELGMPTICSWIFNFISSSYAYISNKYHKKCN